MRRLALLRPGHFAMVMATTIVSVALLEYGYAGLSTAVLAVAALQFATLLLLYCGRRSLWPRLREDLVQADSSFGAFTFVAASTLLGERFIEAGWRPLGWALVALGCLAWIGLAYVVPAAMILQPRKRSWTQVVDGSWLLWVVATESVATGTSIAAVLDPGLRAVLAPAAVAAWSIGVLLYLILITMLTGRLLLHAVETPPGPTYWINMGATAIITLAGARILRLPHVLPAVAFEADAIGTLSFLLWCFGTYLIPLLLILGLWRQAWRQLLRYDVALWSVVFPLGMYSVASGEFGAATHLDFMAAIGRVMLWPALAAWLGAGALGVRLLAGGPGLRLSRQR